MRIKARIQLIITLSLILAATVGLLFFLTILSMKKAVRKEEIVVEVVKGVAELKILTDDYLMHPEVFIT